MIGIDALTDNLWALTYSYLGRCDEAGEYYAKINRTTPYCPRSFEAFKHKKAADAAFRAGDFDSAKINYETALDLQPGFVEVQNNLASTLASTERYTEALALYLDLENKTPTIDTLHEDIAKTYSYLIPNPLHKVTFKASLIYG